MFGTKIRNKECWIVHTFLKSNIAEAFFRKLIQTCVDSFIYWKSEQYCNFLCMWLLMLIFSALLFHIGHMGQLKVHHGFGFFWKCFLFLHLQLPHYENAWQMKNGVQSIAAIPFLIWLLCGKESPERSNYLSFPTLSWILILWYFLAVVKHLNLLKHIKMHKFYISSLCFHKWPAWKDT